MGTAAYDRGHKSPIPGARTVSAPTPKQHARNRRRLIRPHIALRERTRRAQWKADYDANRPSAAMRGYDRRWQMTRDAVLAHHPECAMCGRAGASEVDHIIPHRGDRRLFHDRDNLQPLCRPCHRDKTQMGL